METALGSFWAAVAWHHAYCCHQAKRADSWGFRGVIEWICSSSNLFFEFSREEEEEHLRRTAIEGVLKASASTVLAQSKECLIKNTGPIRASNKRQIEMCRFGRPSGHVVASTAAVHVCSLVFLMVSACLMVDFSSQRCFQLTSMSLGS